MRMTDPLVGGSDPQQIHDRRTVGGKRHCPNADVHCLLLTQCDKNKPPQSFSQTLSCQCKIPTSGGHSVLATHIPRRPFTISQSHEVSALICQSLVLLSVPRYDLSFWFSCVSYLCTKNMEFFSASSHSAVSNILFI